MWPKTYATAVRRQLELRDRLILRGGPRRARTVAGADLSYDRHGDRFHAAVVVLSLPGLELVEQATAEGKSPFPYIPGLLSFREGPLLMRAFARLSRRPELVIFDGQGVAHMRGFGIASHLGLLLDLPSIGCAKSRLVGAHATPGPRVGDQTPLVHEGRRVGAVVRTRRGVKPVFVSPGHRLGLPAAVRWVLKTCAGYRLPEPTRRAHLLANRLRSGG
ncbi:MAG: deoxyribonuclease V [Planctomycetota bacterium]